MTETVQPYREPDATPVGHTGTRVEIRERQAWSLSGWFGVLVVAACIAACIVLAHSSVKGLIAVPIVLAVVVFTSLVIVQPGETGWCGSSATTSAPYVGPACRGSSPSPTGAR
jgi:hypothetical protein